MANFNTLIGLAFFIVFLHCGLSSNASLNAQEVMERDGQPQAYTVDFYVIDWETAKITSSFSKLPIFIYVFNHNSFAEECKKVENSVFKNRDVATLCNGKYISVSADVGTSDGVRLLNHAKKDLRIEKYPTFLFFSIDGELLVQESGIKTISEFNEMIERVELIPISEPILIPVSDTFSDDPNELKVSLTSFDVYNLKNREYQAGNREPEFLKDCINQLKAFPDLYPNLVNDYLTVIPAKEYTSSENLNIIIDNADCYNSKAYLALLANKDIFVAEYGKEMVQQKLKDAIRGAVLAATRTNTGGMQKLNAIMQSAKTLGLTDAASFEFEMRLLYYSQTNRWNDYANLAVSYMKEGKTMQPSNLDVLAWNFIYQVNHPNLLNQASKYFERTISKSSSNAQGRETYAALLYKAGNKRKALKEINTAIQLSKIKGNIYSNSLRLEGIIRSNKPIPSNFGTIEK